jgi:hypothetical protein
MIRILRTILLLTHHGLVAMLGVFDEWQKPASPPSNFLGFDTRNLKQFLFIFATSAIGSGCK